MPRRSSHRCWPRTDWRSNARPGRWLPHRAGPVKRSAPAPTTPRGKPPEAVSHREYGGGRNLVQPLEKAILLELACQGETVPKMIGHHSGAPRGEHVIDIVVDEHRVLRKRADHFE